MDSLSDSTRRFPPQDYTSQKENKGKNTDSIPIKEYIRDDRRGYLDHFSPIQETERAEVPKITLSPAQEKHLKKQSNKRKALKIGATGTSIIFSPALAVLGGVIATSKVLSPEANLWDAGMKRALLPAAFGDHTLEKPDESAECKYFNVTSAANKRGEEGRIHGMVMLAEGFEPQVAAKLPCVVLFCPNGGTMEGYFHKDTEKEKVWDQEHSGTRYKGMANEYREKGFNVVVFNYRGVNDSEGEFLQGDDFCHDGMAVVRQLIEEGLNIGTDDHPILLQPKQDNVVLDGHSIGGMVASYVGKEYPETVLVLSRTFTTWKDAAEGLARKFSNPLYARLTLELLDRSDKAEIMDNIQMNKERLSKKHNLTIVESAGPTGDGVLTTDAKLTEDKLRAEFGLEEQSNLVLAGDTMIKRNEDKEGLIDHNTSLRLAERPKLNTYIVTPNAKRTKHLKDLLDSPRVIALALGQINIVSDRSPEDRLKFLRKINLDEKIEIKCQHPVDKAINLTKKDDLFADDLKSAFAEIDQGEIDSAIKLLKKDMEILKKKMKKDEIVEGDYELLKRSVAGLEGLKIGLSDLKKTPDNAIVLKEASDLKKDISTTLQEFNSDDNRFMKRTANSATADDIQELNKRVRAFHKNMRKDSPLKEIDATLSKLQAKELRNAIRKLQTMQDEETLSKKEIKDLKRAEKELKELAENLGALFNRLEDIAELNEMSGEDFGEGPLEKNATL